MLRCPLAGASSLDIRHCPGFTVELVPAGDVDGSTAVHETCAHLRAESDDRGFFPACHHTEAAWIVPVASRMRERAEVRGAAGMTAPLGLAGRVMAAHGEAAYQIGRTRMLEILRGGMKLGTRSAIA